MTPDVLRVKEKNEKTPRKEGKNIEKQAKDRRKPRGKGAAVDCMPQESQQKHRQVKQAWCRVTKKVPRDRSFDF